MQKIQWRFVEFLKMYEKEKKMLCLLKKSSLHKKLCQQKIYVYYQNDIFFLQKMNVNTLNIFGFNFLFLNLIAISSLSKQFSIFNNNNI